MREREVNITGPLILLKGNAFIGNISNIHIVTHNKNETPLIVSSMESYNKGLREQAISFKNKTQLARHLTDVSIGALQSDAICISNKLSRVSLVST